MSYILEALKKAQAERALGEAPGINSMPLHPAPEPRSGAALWIGLTVGLLLAGAAWLVWHPQAAPPAAPATLVARAVPTVAAPAPAPVRLAPMPDPAPPPAPVPVRAAATPPPAPAVVASATANTPEDGLPTLRELPEAIAREIPQVAIGGYIYSKNPADRLLLVDKMLRHEGEEVAPGLILEKLLPKAALMNYKGYRYKVAY